MCDIQYADVILDNMALGAIMVDREGNVVYANPYARQVVGFRQSEIMGMNYMRPADLEVYDEWGTLIGPEGLAVSRVLKTGEPVHDLILGVKHPGTPMVWVNVNAEPLFDERGELDRVAATFRDITVEKGLRDEKDKALQTHLQIANLVQQAIEQQVTITIRETGLTRREVEILQLIGKGQDNHQIADQLDISEARVRSHVTHIKAKIEARNRVGIALYAIDSGIVSSQIV